LSKIFEDESADGWMNVVKIIELQGSCILEYIMRHITHTNNLLASFQQFTSMLECVQTLLKPVHSF
jgi:hypothetical protein